MFASLCTTFAILQFSAVSCQPINPLKLNVSQNDQPMAGNNVNVKSVIHDGATMAHNPEGTGLFRDPLDVLGPKFVSSDTINLCALHLYVYADVVSKVEFTAAGKKMCTDVCEQYRVNMIFDGPVDVTLLQGYCDYTGASDHMGKCADNDLTATCTCAFKVRCNRRTKMVMYTFQTNCAGFLKVSVGESNAEYHIT